MRRSSLAMFSYLSTHTRPLLAAIQRLLVQKTFQKNRCWWSIFKTLFLVLEKAQCTIKSIAAIKPLFLCFANIYFDNVSLFTINSSLSCTLASDTKKSSQGGIYCQLKICHFYWKYSAFLYLSSSRNRKLSDNFGLTAVMQSISKFLRLTLGMHLDVVQKAVLDG